jgi:hypothetical protein
MHKLRIRCSRLYVHGQIVGIYRQFYTYLKEPMIKTVKRI